jgi:hypothetical protein
MKNKKLAGKIHFILNERGAQLGHEELKIIENVLNDEEEKEMTASSSAKKQIKSGELDPYSPFAKWVKPKVAYFL